MNLLLLLPVIFALLFFVPTITQSQSIGMTITAIADKGSDTITVLGHTASTISDVTYRVASPSGNNIVAIGQLSPDANGDFHMATNAVFISPGEYKPLFRYESANIWGPTITVIDNPVDNEPLPQACVGCYMDDTREITNQFLPEDLPISIWTDKTDYTHSDVIIVKGQVSEESVFPVTLTITSPQNSIVIVKVLPVDSDGSFQTTLNTDGSMWKYDGTYTIIADYNSLEKRNTVEIELTGGVAYTPNYSTPEIQEEKKVYKGNVADNSESDTLEEVLELQRKKIPDWVRTLFILYSQEKISEDELIAMLEFLINEKIIILDQSK